MVFWLNNNYLVHAEKFADIEQAIHREKTINTLCVLLTLRRHAEGCS